jgi:hypothetical protein
MTHPEPILVAAMLAMIPPDAEGKRTVNGVASIWSQLHLEERARFDHIIRRDAAEENARLAMFHPELKS